MIPDVYKIHLPEGLPNEGQVHSQGAVCPGAVDAEEHPVGDARPAGVFRGAVKARLTEDMVIRHMKHDPGAVSKGSARTHKGVI